MYDLLALCGTTLVDIVCTEAKCLKKEYTEGADTCFDIIAYSLKDSVEHLCDVVLYAEKLNLTGLCLAKSLVRKMIRLLKKTSSKTSVQRDLFLKIVAVYCKYSHVFGFDKVSSLLRKQLKSIKCPPGVDEWIVLHCPSVTRKSSTSDYLDCLSWQECEKWLDVFSDPQSSEVDAGCAGKRVSDQNLATGTDNAACFFIDTEGTLTEESEFFTETCDAAGESESIAASNNSFSLVGDGQRENNDSADSRSQVALQEISANQLPVTLSSMHNESPSTLLQCSSVESSEHEAPVQISHESIKVETSPHKCYSEPLHADYVKTGEYCVDRASACLFDDAALTPQKHVYDIKEQVRSCFDLGTEPDSALNPTTMPSSEKNESIEKHHETDLSDVVTCKSNLSMNSHVENSDKLEMIDHVILQKDEMINERSSTGISLVVADNEESQDECNRAKDAAALEADHAEDISNSLNASSESSKKVIENTSMNSAGDDNIMALDKFDSSSKNRNDKLANCPALEKLPIDGVIERNGVQTENLPKIQTPMIKTKRVTRTFVKSRNSWCSLIKSSFEREADDWLDQKCDKSEWSINIAKNVNDNDDEKISVAICDREVSGANIKQASAEAWADDEKHSTSFTQCKILPSPKLRSSRKRIITEGKSEIELKRRASNVTSKLLRGKFPVEEIEMKNATPGKDMPPGKCAGTLSTSTQISTPSGSQTPRYLTRSQAKTNKQSFPLDAL